MNSARTRACRTVLASVRAVVTLRVAFACAIGVVTALGSLAPMLRWAELPAAAASSETGTRYQLVWLPHAGAESARSEPAQKQKNDPQTPRLFKAVTDLWDTAPALHFAVDIPVKMPLVPVPAGVLRIASASEIFLPPESGPPLPPARGPPNSGV